MATGRIVTNKAGDQLELVGGEWRPVEDLLTSLMPDPGGIVSGMVRGAENVAQRAGFLDQSDERDAAFRREAALNPGSVLLGQGAAGASAAFVPEAIAARGVVAAVPRIGQFGRGVVSSLAGGAGAALTVEGNPLDAFAEGVGGDIALASTLGAAQAAFPMAARVFRGIMGIRPFRRKVEAGDTGEVSQELLEGVQGIGATPENPRGFELTPAQASGIVEELELEDSLRANPFRSGPFNAIDARNQKILNQRAGDSIGLTDVNLLGKTTMDRAQRDITDSMRDMVEAVGDMKVIPDDLDEFIVLADRFDIDQKTKNIITGHAETLADAVDISPTLYQSVRQKLTASMMQANKVQGAGQDVQALQMAIDTLDQLPSRTITRNGGDPEIFLDAFGAEREKFRNVIALKTSNAVTPDGNVSPLRLRRNLERVYGDTFRLGRVDDVRNKATGDLFKITDAVASERLQFHVGGSPTARRQGVENAIETVAELATSPQKSASALLTGAFNVGAGPLHLSTPNSPDVNALLRAFGVGAGSAAAADNE